MVKKEDIVKGTYLRQTTDQFGSPPGLIAVVDDVGTGWVGQWYFQVRYLNHPVGAQTRAASSWSVQLREDDLAHFELVGTWIPADVLLAPVQPSVKPLNTRRSSAWGRGRRRRDLQQLCLFDNW